MEKPTGRKRRWVMYAMVTMAGFFLLAVIGLLALGAYRDWLIKTYTAGNPKPLPKVESSPAALQALQTKWDGFFRQLADRQSLPPPPLKLSAEEINLFISQIPDLKSRVYVSMESNRLGGEFSVPLSKFSQGKLKDRFLTGTATFNVLFENGFPTLTLGSLEANGRPIPKWILSKLQKKNLVEDLDWTKETKDRLGELKNIEVRDGFLTFVPEER